MAVSPGIPTYLVDVSRVILCSLIKFINVSKIKTIDRWQRRYLGTHATDMRASTITQCSSTRWLNVSGPFVFSNECCLANQLGCHTFCVILNVMMNGRIKKTII